MSGLRRIGDKVEIPFIGKASDPLGGIRRMARHDNVMSDKLLVPAVFEDTLVFHCYASVYGRSSYGVLKSETNNSTYTVSIKYLSDMIPYMTNGRIKAKFTYTKPGGEAYSIKLYAGDKNSTWKALVTEYGMIRNDYSQEGLIARGYSAHRGSKLYGKNDFIKLALRLKRIVTTCDNFFYAEFEDINTASPGGDCPIYYMFGSDFNRVLRKGQYSRGILEGDFRFRKNGTHYGVVYTG